LLPRQEKETRNDLTDTIAVGRGNCHRFLFFPNVLIKMGRHRKKDVARKKCACFSQDFVIIINIFFFK
jgi:hypothetical protein